MNLRQLLKADLESRFSCKAELVWRTIRSSLSPAPRRTRPGRSSICVAGLRGARLTLSTEDGESLGAVTPYPPGRQSNTATVPVPRSAIVDGRLRLRLQVLEPARQRAPRPGEVQRVDLVVAPRGE